MHMYRCRYVCGDDDISNPALSSDSHCGLPLFVLAEPHHVRDVVAERVAPSKKEYEKRILGMKKMFADGEKYEVDWWPDESGDANPKNPYYK